MHLAISESSSVDSFPNSKIGRYARALPWLSLAISLFAAGGVVFALWLRTQWVGQPDPRNWFNVFSVLFSRNEPAGLGLVVAFAGLTALWLSRGARVVPRKIQLRPESATILIAIAACALAGAGYFVVFQQYALTADENMADFQARIFLSGKLRAVVPAFWQPMVHLIMPTHGSYFPALQSWNSSYLPVYAAFRALFMSVNLEGLLNPIFAGISVLTIAAVTHKFWPTDPWKPLIAAALLASSSQFLLTSMTGYAMPAHLALNLIWLWLYFDPTKRRFWLAPFVGVAALGLHQPFFHALFVAPFLARLVRDRRWKASFIFALVYAVGIIGWLQWWRHFLPNFTGAGSSGTFSFQRSTWITQSIYLCLLIGWTAFPVPLLASLGFARIRKLPPFLQDAALSCCLTFGFYVFVRLDQAHGWGDRYFHGTLGCLILVAIAGWDSLCQRIGKQAAGTFVVTGVIASLLVQFPLRCFQAERFVYPYAHAAEQFHDPKFDLAGFNPLHAWYSADLIRNDPFLEQGPIVISFLGMTETQARLLQKSFPRKRLFREEDLKRMGLATKIDP